MNGSEAGPNEDYGEESSDSLELLTSVVRYIHWLKNPQPHKNIVSTCLLASEIRPPRRLKLSYLFLSVTKRLGTYSSSSFTITLLKLEKCVKTGPHLVKT